ncbi:NAD(P)/FAD-dependent oxidoreductase [Clostridium hydrogeniformans]|uniref:NAD(P)/FAD-dependent oxidoreductase n=1 Tax=Clostridium hydrogeniformans TaxID=349933 RepID=UPI00047F2992|nr:NAD(P)/FAD-dependent oxidoreductase [Clostridium hydrogeniformans]
MSKVIVIGGGPSGMMAALQAAKEHEVTLIDGNNKLGKKLYITGKGRCNVTNGKDISEFFDYIPGNPHFLYSSLYTFTNLDTIKLLESLGVPLKTERGDRVFPCSDKSSDIIGAFNSALIDKKVSLKLGCKVKDFIVKEENEISGVLLEDDTKISGDYFILCTGGVSYPLTGSTGDGLKLSKKLGHSIIPPKASLVPVQVSEPWIKDLQGLSLKNVEINILSKENKSLYKDFGEMLFTHYGASGPIILSGSRVVENGKTYKLSINLKPALSEKEMDLRLQKDFSKYINKDFKNSLEDLLPQKLIDVVIKLSGIDENKKVHLIKKEERKELGKLIQNFTLTVVGTRPIAEAIVTAGGVNVKEIDPSTMKSKIVNNLYFAGEVMDVDAFTGGYNVQIAFSTGYLAGTRVGE